MNTAIFAGRLGRDADLRVTPGGQSVTNFSVAVDVGFGDEKKTLWVGCALWGERAEKLTPYLTKGKSVTVSGDVNIRTYDTRDGQHRAELTLNVQRVTFQGDAQGAKPKETTAQPAAHEPAKDAPAQADWDDEILF